MNKIASFCINHDRLRQGIYLSRIDGDVLSYDLRMKKPNNDDYLDQAGLHTLEHLFATYMRNSNVQDHVIYIGPMGCRTGFYLLVRDSLSQEDVIALVKEACCYAADFEGEIPGAGTSAECGNYREHDLAKARQYAREYRAVMESVTIADLSYPEEVTL